MGLEWIFILVALCAGFLFGKFGPALRGAMSSATSVDTERRGAKPRTGELFGIAKQLERAAHQTDYPSSLLDLPDFMRGVTLILEDALPTPETVNLVKGDNWIVSCMAGEALCRKTADEDVSASLLSGIRHLEPWPLYFVLKYLLGKEDQPMIGPVLGQAQSWWQEAPPMVSLMSEFFQKRLDMGETPTLAGVLDRCTADDASTMAAFLGALRIEGLKPMLAEIEAWQSTHVDASTLNTIGRVWTVDACDDVVQHEALLQQVTRAQSYLEEPSFRSVLLVGDSGVGKSTLVRVLASRMQQRGWTVFEADATDLLAGQMFVGLLEDRLKTLLDGVGVKRRVIWYAPNFHEFLHAGVHQHDPTGLLDRILPAIEHRRIVLLGETTPEGHGRLVQNRPRLRAAVDTQTVKPLSDDETLSIALQWAERHGSGPNAVTVDERTIGEAFNAVKQCLTGKGAPGSLLEVLHATCKHKATAAHAARNVSISDVLETLSQMTGLPQAMLDDRLELNIEALREGFHQRITGQTEAVTCIVERIAMLKAGLNDTSRPLGVFLFVGPTGTGKTEIAKTLARFLFGSEDRMIRLDMSEFQTLDSMGRLIGQDQSQTSDSLVGMVRKQPFSVVLLDEFEKAHPQVWDLLLQVFDDGRLTDLAGNLGDFRHSIIILTSNLGARITGGTNIGFKLGGATFSRSAVEREVNTTFRPEFINRIDRIVVFHPLSRDVMQKILRRELKDVLGRRGFRKRDWAVEWDESAVDFLLEKGFTPDLGARPLRRAVERYLLSPLSMTIVNHDYPEGDQFLFITSDGSDIAAEFVDPDAPMETPRGVVDNGAPVPEPRDVRLLVLDARGSPGEFALLEAELGRIETLTAEQSWETMKEEALAQTSAPGFWDLADRIEILSRIEVMDRIESGVRGARSLLRRLAGHGARARTGYLPELLRRLAEQLYLLDVAYSDFRGDRPHEAFVLVESQQDPHTPAQVASEFFEQIHRMYLHWAKKRRMRYRQLQMQAADGDRRRGMIAVSGFGAFSILEPETGLHLLDLPSDKRAHERCRVRVRVVPQPKESAQTESELLKQAESAFALTKEGTPRVVRHYRAEPSPLVRDSVRGWRTGRLDRVLSGDFDLVA